MSAEHQDSRGRMRRWIEWFWLGDRLKSAEAERNALAQNTTRALALHDLALRVRHNLVRVDATAKSLAERSLLQAGLEQLGVRGEAKDASLDILRSQHQQQVAHFVAIDGEPTRLRAQRWLRCAPPTLLLVFSVILLARQVVPARTNLAAGMPWVTTSSYTGYERSGRISKEPTSHMFFSTNKEQNPWLSIDLQRPKEIAAFLVQNRSDCCNERPVPLVAEVSLDGKEFREVARQTQPFKDWEASFHPVTARYFRFRSLKETWLHFRHVSLYAP